MDDEITLETYFPEESVRTYTYVDNNGTSFLNNDRKYAYDYFDTDVSVDYSSDDTNHIDINIRKKINKGQYELSSLNLTVKGEPISSFNYIGYLDSYSGTGIKTILTAKDNLLTIYNIDINNQTINEINTKPLMTVSSDGRYISSDANINCFANINVTDNTVKKPLVSMTFIGTDKGLYSKEERTKVFTEVNGLKDTYPEDSYLSTTYATVTDTDKNKRLFAGNKNGLFIFDPENHDDNSTLFRQISNTTIGHLHAFSDGGIVATGAGGDNILLSIDAYSQNIERLYIQDESQIDEYYGGLFYGENNDGDIVPLSCENGSIMKVNWNEVKNTSYPNFLGAGNDMHYLKPANDGISDKQIIKSIFYSSDKPPKRTRQMLVRTMSGTLYELTSNFNTNTYSLLEVEQYEDALALSSPEAILDFDKRNFELADGLSCKNLNETTSVFHDFNIGEDLTRYTFLSTELSSDNTEEDIIINPVKYTSSFTLDEISEAEIDDGDLEFDVTYQINTLTQQNKFELSGDNKEVLSGYAIATISFNAYTSYLTYTNYEEGTMPDDVREEINKNPVVYGISDNGTLMSHQSYEQDWISRPPTERVYYYNNTENTVRATISAVVPVLSSIVLNEENNYSYTISSVDSSNINLFEILHLQSGFFADIKDVEASLEFHMFDSNDNEVDVNERVSVELYSTVGAEGTLKIKVPVLKTTHDGVYYDNFFGINQVQNEDSSTEDIEQPVAGYFTSLSPYSSDSHDSKVYFYDGKGLYATRIGNIQTETIENTLGLLRFGRIGYNYANVDALYYFKISGEPFPEQIRCAFNASCNDSIEEIEDLSSFREAIGGRYAYGSITDISYEGLSACYVVKDTGEQYGLYCSNSNIFPRFNRSEEVGNIRRNTNNYLLQSIKEETQFVKIDEDNSNNLFHYFYAFKNGELQYESYLNDVFGILTELQFLNKEDSAIYLHYKYGDTHTQEMSPIYGVGEQYFSTELITISTLSKCYVHNQRTFWNRR